MAKKTIKPDGIYTVKLKKPVKHGGTWMRPGATRVRVSGRTLEDIKDAVAEYAEVDA